MAFVYGNGTVVAVTPPGPDNGGDPDTSAVAGADSGIPQTGDDARIDLWAILMLGAAAVMICGLLIFKKLRHRAQQPE